MARLKRAVLTGGSGFIGRQAIAALVARNFQVHVVSRTRQLGTVSGTNVGGSVQYHQCDLMRPLQVASLIATLKPSHLLHFAWDTAHGEFWTSEQNLHWVSASLDLLREFCANGGSRVVFAGSCAEYSWGPDLLSERLSERSPATLYGVCKSALYSILEAFCKRQGVSSSWGRVFFLYGPNENPSRLVSSAICSLLQNRPFAASVGHQRRDYMHVADVAKAFAQLLDSGIEGPLNIASGIEVTVRGVLNTIGSALGKCHLLEFGSREVAIGEPEAIVADITRLRDELRFTPELSLATGILQTIEWWKNELTRQGSIAPPTSCGR